MKGKKEKLLYALLLMIYLAATICVGRVAASESIIMIAGKVIPVSSLAGVLSSLANVSIICLVVFFNRLGFRTSCVIISIQFVLMVVSMVLRDTVTSIPGIFSNVFTILSVIIIHRRNITIEKYQQKEIVTLTQQRRLSQRLFEQTATALVNAVDAKDEYSHGHSLRVAEYSEKIARELGKSEDECHRIYYAALLHDVGKIGIPDSIINKNGKLTPEEYDVIKQHPVMGNQILSSISEYPYLSIGAHYHHERYDGKGYPDKLKGEDIPEIARIISVADAYDAMTSNRSYRDAIPQQIVREEIVKGAGAQFDPEFAKIMQHLIDLDGEYKMKERNSVNELAGRDELVCGSYRSSISDGLILMPKMVSIHMRYTPDPGAEDARIPSIILFDSLDGRVYEDEKLAKELNYFEFCEITLDGKILGTGFRRQQVLVFDNESHNGQAMQSGGSIVYDIDAVKKIDHVLIKIDDGTKITEITLALPDSSRFTYLSFTGAYCRIGDVNIRRANAEIAENYIARIAEKVNYLEGPDGDIPNVQIDEYRTASSEAIPISDGLKITFHAKSLPTARLIWHCAFIDIFYSDDKKINGKNYSEYALVRLDGENWESDSGVVNRLFVNKNENFEGWEAWKKACKEGFDCLVSFEKKEGQITLTTRNNGVEIRNITVLQDPEQEVYAAITGDQVAITNIRISS